MSSGDEARAALRSADRSDAPSLAAIYSQAVRTSVATFDLADPGEAHFADLVATAADPTRPVLVATVEDRVVGYAYASVYRPRAAYAGTRETSIYLDGSHTGRGIGRLLYAELLRRLDEAGCHTTLALVALPNPASVALHRALGFRHVGTMREVGHKLGRWVDTAWYQRLASPTRPR